MIRKALVLVTLFVFGCASAPDKVRAGIVIGLHAVTATGAIVDEIDKEKIASAKTNEDLDKWDAQYVKIQKALRLLWDTMRLAADAVSAYEKGSAPKVDFAALSADIFKALADLTVALKDAGVKVPGVSD